MLGKDIPNECVNVHSNGVTQSIEHPLVLAVEMLHYLTGITYKQLHDDYCLDSQDTLTFEIRKGCKFNCSFCSYEFRNAKDVLDVDSRCTGQIFSMKQ